MVLGSVLGHNSTPGHLDREVRSSSYIIWTDSCLQHVSWSLDRETYDLFIEIGWVFSPPHTYSCSWNLARGQKYRPWMDTYPTVGASTWAFEHHKQVWVSDRQRLRTLGAKPSLDKR